MTQQHRNGDISPDRVDLRDSFAAAALTGILANPHDDLLASDDSYATMAYELADAMFRERLRQFDRSQPIKPAEDTHATHATPCEGSVQGEGTLTDEEREAVYRAEARLRTAYVPDDATAATLRKLLARLA
jgi:hypothetical protein